MMKAIYGKKSEIAHIKYTIDVTKQTNESNKFDANVDDLTLQSNNKKPEIAVIIAIIPSVIIISGEGTYVANPC